MASPATTRELTIRLPEPLVYQTEQVAIREHADLSDVVERALTAYNCDVFERRLTQLRPSQNANEQFVTQDEIEEMVDQIRTESHHQRTSAR